MSIRSERKCNLIIYVDNGGIFCETREEIKQMIDKLSKYFVVKDPGNMEIFFGCIIFNNK
jgi:hypothetical protein